MKIQCDVCGEEEASVFCTADEAALCGGCDLCVHHANELAGKHFRFSLLHTPAKESPRCDICQERRAFIFCKEDRALLCRECDIPIHAANELTQKHNRFLLTAIKLSTASSSSSAYQISDSIEKSSINGTESEISDGICKANSMESGSTNQEGSVSTSSISMSDLLMETLPGWRVDDFLEPTFGFCKIEEQFSPFNDVDIQSNSLSFLAPQELAAIWVPQAGRVLETDEVNGGVGRCIEQAVKKKAITTKRPKHSSYNRH